MSAWNASYNPAYWDAFYADQMADLPLTPSQFADFVLNELPQMERVVEIGCGNGRDADYFANCGKEAFAIDASPVAFNWRNTHMQHPRITHICADVSGCAKHLEPLFTEGEGISTVLYARFFLHAITEAEEESFLMLAARMLRANDFLALEYRSTKDEPRYKHYSQHFRRYISHAALCEKLKQYGFSIFYEVEGAGMATHQEEDAIVGRCLATVSEVRKGR